QQVTNAYGPALQKRFRFISYGTSKSVDFQRMENEARAMLQNVKDEASEITEQLTEHQEQAQGVLADVRRVAAEQGVSQQAIYFKDEAEAHETLAETWRSRTTKLDWGLGAYAFISIFFHKWSWLQPEDTIQS